MTDRELLEFAAKAIDCSIVQDDGEGSVWIVPIEKDAGYGFWWNPLTDDGDALRLAVKLNIPVIPYDDETSTGTSGVVAKNWGSKEENTRRAIVRAAAEIGKAMP